MSGIAFVIPWVFYITGIGGTANLTTLPVTYVTATSQDVMDDPTFLERIREAPPNVLHLGHVLPLNSIFGPTADYSGFNPKLVPAEEILARRARIREFMDRLHGAGVDRVVCYINPAILGGDHITREGFWLFYDHWDEYRALGIGPKPDRDPVLWVQRERQSFGQWAPEPNYPLWLYRPCVNEPAWRSYQETVVRLAAESGYDGVFVDDCIIECHHDACARRFGEYLKGAYERRAFDRLFGRDTSLGALQPLWQGDSAATLRDVETLYFWQRSMRDYLGRIRAVGRQWNPDFIVVANWGAISRVRGAAGRAQSGKDIEVWRPATEWVMLEEAHPSGYLGPRDVFGYLLQYNQSLMLGVRPVVHSYAMTEEQSELGHAECAAGGGGAFVQPDLRFPGVRKKWRDFYESNRTLFEGFSIVAPVGLVLAFDELRYNNKEHLRQALATAHALYASHVPFAAMPKSKLLSVRPAEHRVLILPHVVHLDDKHVRALNRFVGNGGRLLLAGPNGTCDLRTQPREEAGGISARGTGFDGDRILHIASMEDIVPRRAFDVVAALDLLDPNEFATRVNEIAIAPADSEEEKQLADTLERLAGADLSVALGPPQVRTVVYRKLGRHRGTITLHAVRYAASITGEAGAMIDPQPLRVAVSLPESWKFERATVRVPGAPVTDVQVSIAGDVIGWTAPPFDYYALTALEIRRR